MKTKKIILVTSGQPSLNPRLVKEADTLAAVGYDVTVIYSYWNEWGSRFTTELLLTRPWKAICAGGDPQDEPFKYFVSRLRFKLTRLMLEKTNNFASFGRFAIARASYALMREAQRHKADLYIGHNLGALAAVVEAAKTHQTQCGFDAEDFHRQEINDNKNSTHYRLCKYLEDVYLPQIGYLSASSPLTAEKYASLYKRTVIPVLNVFDRVVTPSPINKDTKALKLFWFSQTLGNNRGLEQIIIAIALSKIPFELHLIGAITDHYRNDLFIIAKKNSLSTDNIYFQAPVKGDELFIIAAQMDIGIASETGFCLNNQMALSNKLFTYLQSGLAILASDTLAQKKFMQENPGLGQIYGNTTELAAALKTFDQNRDMLLQTRIRAFNAGQAWLNWDNEKGKILSVVNDVFI